MVEARNANYATISRQLCFGKRGAANVEPEISSAGSSRPEKGRHAAETLDNGSDSDDEMPPEPKLLRVSTAPWTAPGAAVCGLVWMLNWQ